MDAAAYTKPEEGDIEIIGTIISVFAVELARGTETIDGGTDPVRTKI